MIILEADNRSLTKGAKYTYTQVNISSGVTSFFVLNATDSAFAHDAIILLGNFGAEDAEILSIDAVNSVTGEISLNSPTNFAHSESTRISVIAYDHIAFYHTDISTFDINAALEISGSIPLQPSDWFTTFSDEVRSTGWGWYTFHNSITDVYSQESNGIPYGGFESDTTENILSDFFSMLSNKELKLVTREDALSWASEGYGRMKNKLNWSNVEYSVSDITPLNIVSGQIEYDLPVDFDHLISFLSGVSAADPGARGGIKFNIDFIPLREAYWYNGTGPRYYIRKNKIGILPTPAENTTFHYNYQKKATRLTLNTDEVELPNGGEYVIKDWMLYRAFQKFQNPQYKTYLESYTNGLNDMIIASVKRDANLDWWGIQRQSNV